MLSIETLKSRLQKEEEKRDKAESNIKKIKAQIEQVEITEIKATMEEHNINLSDLKELLKDLNN
jgi:flagellar motor switch protein FliM